MSLSELMARHTRKQGECLIWTGCCTRDNPRGWLDGKSILMRRALWIEAGNDLEKTTIIKTICQTPKCIEVSHFRTFSLEVLRKNYVVEQKTFVPEPEPRENLVPPRTISFGGTYVPEAWQSSRHGALDAFRVASAGVPT